jgi:hypothetical protein
LNLKKKKKNQYFKTSWGSGGSQPIILATQKAEIRKTEVQGQCKGEKAGTPNLKNT